ncbi:MAG: hypothetical protein N2Z79_03175, partial [Candidatus Omnitrophica bacterium]|nr:hypothetical protein [Candidatus Omnitrophota bacterium]
MFIRISLAIFLISLIFNVSLAEEFVQIPLAVHISSNISDGKYTIEEIVKILRDNNFKAVVITDRDLMEWEYGIWPLRNIIKKK